MNLVIQALFCLKNNFLNLKMIRSVFFPQNYFGGPCLGDLTLVFHQLCHLLLQEYLICINKWEDIWTLFSTKNQIPSEALPDLRAFWRGIDKKKKKSHLWFFWFSKYFTLPAISFGGGARFRRTSFRCTFVSLCSQTLSMDHVASEAKLVWWFLTLLTQRKSSKLVILLMSGPLADPEFLGCEAPAGC